FASHFAPAMMMDALRVYRDNFKPSESFTEPYVMLGFNVCAAETLEEAEYLRSSSVMSFLNLRKGAPRRLPPPVPDLDQKLEPLDRAILAEMKSPVALGDKDMIAEGLADFIDQTGANELMLVCSMYDHDKRVRSFEITAEAAKSLNWTAAT
ncbi:MAG TPA: LLM class flavin-dependent oxidoreductase, partial [Pseudomonadales bacterium]|nr:LLM class flavin-dependent oxidoreductase [Pseudomonadales bacterium]